MQKHLEIEYKNLLAHEEYQTIFRYFKFKEKDFFSQYNIYWDNEQEDLKKLKSALRIRIKDSEAEITLKTPDHNHLMEYNQPLTIAQATKMAKQAEIEISPEIQAPLNHLNLKAFKFKKLCEFQTVRVEEKIQNCLLVLDKTIYNQKVDYELEIEANREDEGILLFKKILKQFNIPQRETLPKIARAINYQA